MGDEGSGGYVVNNCLDAGRRNGTFGMNIFVASAFFSGIWTVATAKRLSQHAGAAPDAVAYVHC